jgi:hypothetical protein
VSGATQWITLDFGREYEYGGIVVDWEPGAEARAFDVQLGRRRAGRLWSRARPKASGASTCPAVVTRATCVSTCWKRPRHGAFGIRPGRPSFEFSRSLAEFFHAVAAAEPRGHSPRWLHREQSYWTAVGVAGASSAAIMNEEGMLEPDRGSPSLEPFLYVDGALVTWADVEPAIALAHDCLPIPSSTWRHRGLVLTTTAFAVADPTGPVARAWYRVVNEETTPKRVRLFITLRPFQVTPPWQSFEGLGGPARVRALSWRGGAVVVDNDWRVVPLTPPSGFGAAAFEQGGVLRHLVRGELPPRTEVEDAFGYASGALAWDLELAPGAARDVHVAVPFAERPALGPVTQAEVPVASLTTLDGVTRYWERKLAAVACLPASAEGVWTRFAPRPHTSWSIATARRSARPASLRAVVDSRRRDHVRRAGADGLYRRGTRLPRLVRAVSGPRRERALRGRPQGRRLAAGHDSHGQFVFTLAGTSASRDPTSQRACGRPHGAPFMEALRAQRGPEFREPEKRARFASCRSRSATRAIWRSRFTPTGMTSGLSAGFATRRSWRGRSAKRQTPSGSKRYARRCIVPSRVDRDDDRHRALSYVPGSVEWADFDQRNGHGNHHDRRGAGAATCRARGPSTNTWSACAGGAPARSTGTSTLPTSCASSARW